jgi:hypothetical protein
MRLATRAPVVALGLALVTPVTVAAQGPVSTSPDPGTSSVAQPLLWLRGAFGTVPAGDDAPLDVFVRGAPLRLETGDPDVGIGEWRASFQVSNGDSATVDSAGTGDGGQGTDGITLAAPDGPGTYRLDVVAALDTGAEGTATWTIVVPDRPLPPDGLIEVPAPSLLLTGGLGTVAGWSGSGCYIYLCVDVGRLPPLREVSHTDVTAGEDLELRLSDGSGIAAWKVTFYPIVSRLQPAMDEIGDEPDSPVDSFVLEAPVAGEWLMQVELTYDRLRGWAHAFYRLTAHSG